MDSENCGVDSGDAGSLLNDTHVVFQCESCRSIVGDSTSWIAATEALELGRRYITTPSYLDQLRDNFSLYVSMATSYQLGSASVKAMADSKSQESPLLLKVAERCMKLQYLVVMINQRVCKIEQCLQDDGEAH